MKPVAIFRHFAGEGPGYFATFLERHNIPWKLICVDEEEVVPASTDDFSGLCFMGGPMSVNDDLPWIPPLLALIRKAVAQDVPVLGHCLGGQLIAKALGAVVTRNPVKEIGWGEVRALPGAADWFGPEARFTVFHWHGETFSIPPGASRLLESDYCPNQAYALGPHLGLQCHVEMTAAMVRGWGANGKEEIERAFARAAPQAVPSVQTAAQMETDLEARLQALHQVADRLYARWIAGLRQ